LYGAQQINLNGLGGDDSFTFTPGATLNGTIDGGAGSDTLDFSAYPTGLQVQLVSATGGDGFSGNSAGVLAGFARINTILASGTNSDQITGTQADGQWTVDGSNTYTSNGSTLNFSGFETLVGGSGVDRFDIVGSQAFDLDGGAGDDIFAFADGAHLTGNINGNVGDDLLDYSAYTVARRILLTGYESDDGFIGIDASLVPALIGIFNHINLITGSSDPVDPDVLVGLDRSAQWVIGYINTYHVNPTLTYDSFETLMGGDGQDTFEISGKQDVTLVGGGGDDEFYMEEDAEVDVINGQGGEDKIYYKTTTPVTYDPVVGTAPGIGGGFSSIEVVGLYVPPPPPPPAVPVIIPQQPGEPEVVRLPILVIRVDSDELTNITCRACAGVVLRLEEGNQVFFGLGNGNRASLAYLPALDAQPQGYTPVYTLRVNLAWGAYAVAQTGTPIQVSFVVPACFAGRQLAIFYWDTTLNAGAGGWVELDTTFLAASQSGDYDRVQAWTSHTGTFMLAVRGVAACDEGNDFFAAPAVP
ncbi:MAG: hypothetical protein GYA17_06735, partial [Chloroflexi bacterium]|nr:hypothetical protein [Chloroflexota bacterium]